MTKPTDKEASRREANRIRQENFRARRAINGMAEVRGIFLAEQQHEQLKRYAQRLAREHLRQIGGV